MTLAEWKRQFTAGQKWNCTYRWYWGTQKPAPPDGTEPIVIRVVRATQLIYSTPTCERSWMNYPKASDLKATEKGFELYFPKEAGDKSGLLMSRYERVPCE